MAADYPDDADGQALARIAADGSDMSRPMLVDFHIAAPDEARAERIAQAVAKQSYQTQLEYDEKMQEWTVWCSRHMIATHPAVQQAQAELDELSQPYDGFTDGWGSFGNVDTA